METLTMTKEQARRVFLAQQGLWPPYQLVGKTGVLDYIRRVGCIQFDPLDIVGRNPELVLHARVADFRPAMLQELLYQDRQLLDGWDKMMSIYGVADWPYFERRRASALHDIGSERAAPVVAILPRLRQAIAEQGPVSSLDLHFNETVDWTWAPTRLARAALECGYFCGELIVHHKVHTRKVYDFAARHLPAEILSAPDPNATEEQFHDWYVLRRLGSVGMLWPKAGDAWIGMLNIKSKARQAALTRLHQQGQVIEIRVAGLDAPLYMRSADRPHLDTLAADAANRPPRAAIIAPLDNLLWDRRLALALFDFEYRWEVYKPVAERQYGYYVLPVLYGDRFVARFEPGRDKKNGTVTIKQWWWEPDVTPSDAMRASLRECFQRLLHFLGAATLKIERHAIKHADLAWLKMAAHE